MIGSFILTIDRYPARPPACPLARFLSSNGLVDVRMPPRAPDLIGNWLLGASAPGSKGSAKELENEVFARAAVGAVSDKGSGMLVRLPPARAGGVFEATPWGPPAPPLKQAREVWGFSAKLTPLFPSEFGGAHPRLRRRFDAFTELVWGEKEHAQAVNAQMIR